MCRDDSVEDDTRAHTHTHTPVMTGRWLSAAATFFGIFGQSGCFGVSAPMTQRRADYLGPPRSRAVSLGRRRSACELVDPISTHQKTGRMLAINNSASRPHPPSYQLKTHLDTDQTHAIFQSGETFHQRAENPQKGKWRLPPAFLGWQGPNPAWPVKPPTAPSLAKTFFLSKHETSLNDTCKIPWNNNTKISFYV